MKGFTLAKLVKALLLLWSVTILLGILLDPLGDHPVWQPLTCTALLLAVGKYEKGRHS